MPSSGSDCPRDGAMLPRSFPLGTMFASGTGFSRDPHEVMRWFLLAAVQGHQQALHELRALTTSTGEKQSTPETPCLGKA